jgi:hypothetical protein
VGGGFVNRVEAAQLLAVMSKLDNRRADDGAVDLWHKLLMDVSFADAAEAVRRHFASSVDYLMPVHVLRGAQVVMAERHQLERAAIPAPPGRFDAHNPAQRGPLLVRHVLARLAEAKQQMGGSLGRELAAELGETFMAEALERYPATKRPVQVAGAHCRRAGCQCTHTDGCDGGWIEVAPAEAPDPVLFGEQEAPAVEDQGGRVRPCPMCRPTVVEIVDAASTRRAAGQALRLRRVGKR